MTFVISGVIIFFVLVAISIVIIVCTMAIQAPFWFNGFWIAQYLPTFYEKHEEIFSWDLSIPATIKFFLILLAIYAVLSLLGKYSCMFATAYLWVCAGTTFSDGVSFNKRILSYVISFIIYSIVYGLFNDVIEKARFFKSYIAEVIASAISVFFISYTLTCAWFSDWHMHEKYYTEANVTLAFRNGLLATAAALMLGVGYIVINRKKDEKVKQEEVAFLAEKEAEKKVQKEKQALVNNEIIMYCLAIDAIRRSFALMTFNDMQTKEISLLLEDYHELYKSSNSKGKLQKLKNVLNNLMDIYTTSNNDTDIIWFTKCQQNDRKTFYDFLTTCFNDSEKIVVSIQNEYEQIAN